jgi:hypothetical protein
MAPSGFVGVDLAWGLRAQTGLAVVDDARQLVQSDAVWTDDEIDEWLRTFAGDVVLPSTRR